MSAFKQSFGWTFAGHAERILRQSRVGTSAGRMLCFCQAVCAATCGSGSSSSKRAVNSHHYTIDMGLYYSAFHVHSSFILFCGSSSGGGAVQSQVE